MNQYDATFYPFFASLSVTNQSVYLQLLRGIENVEKVIELSTFCSYEDVLNTLYALSFDHPELFWMSRKGDIVLRDDKAVGFEPNYPELVNNLEYHKGRLARVVDNYLKDISNLSQAEQEKYVHDRLVREVSYVHGKNDQNAYSALVEKKAICAGYSRAFQLIMQNLGIPCYCCSGTAINETNSAWERHAWNIIKLGADFYNIDVTWNDCFGRFSNKVDYTYYNCTDEQFLKDHRKNPEFSFLPECRGTLYGYQTLYGSKSALPERKETQYRREIVSRSNSEEIPYTVVMNSFGKDKIKVINIVRSVTGYGLADTKDLVENLPAEITKVSSPEEADIIRGKLKAAGAMVDIRLSKDGRDILFRSSSEDTPYTVVMNSFGKDKIKVIKIIRRITGYGLADAKDLVENLPAEITKVSSPEEADIIKGKLEAAGAVVVIN